METGGTCFMRLPMKLNDFPCKLWHLVNNYQMCSICWDTSGEGILIYQELFIAEVLFSHDGQMSKYFKTRDFASFVRQLHLYGFRKVSQDHDTLEKQLSSTFLAVQMHHFYNPNFKRDNPELLVNLKRLTPVNRPKLVIGIQVPDQSSGDFNYRLLNSPEKNSPVLNNGAIIVGNQGSSNHHHSKDFQQGPDCDRTPKPSQAFLMGHGDPGSMFRNFSTDSPCAHPSSSMYMQQGLQTSVHAGMLGTFIPHYPQYRFYAPGYQCCSQGLSDSNTACFQHPAACYAYCGYYPDSPGIFLQCTDQNPNMQAADAQDPGESGGNRDTGFNLSDELQDSPGIFLQCTDQNPNMQAADAQDPGESGGNRDTGFNLADELQDYLSTFLQCTDQNPIMQAADAQDPGENGPSLNTGFNLADELQDYLSTFLQCTDQNPNMQAADAQDPGENGPSLNTGFNLADELQAATSFILPASENYPLEIQFE